MVVSFGVKPQLVGKLVTLRPVTVADAPGLVELLHDPEVRRLTGTPGRPRPGTLQRAEQWYRDCASAEDRLDLAIVERAGGTYVGEVALADLDAGNRSCSFRISLVGPRAFGRGYGSEATRLTLGHAFDTVGLHRVELEVYESNPRARHVYERAGFVHEGTKREALHQDGAWIDAHQLAVLASDRPDLTT
ncbi:MAG: Acetyltransferase, GNAT family [uncultured Corynebacteriales bacterium]|uniref:Acetyltransferase, GNAT family n=1 Tax=uncultured Mycobacteriales bacterium TaxID=581187 RepID=A0A6J4HPX3_9ACTN|nr:MAG: Acetyltransferase, GNAT family [uncultured Corynebacteriales bacterium]